MGEGAGDVRMTTHIMSMGSLANAIYFDDVSEVPITILEVTDPDDPDTTTPVADGLILRSLGGAGQFPFSSIASDPDIVSSQGSWADNEMVRWHTGGPAAIMQGSSIFLDDSQNMTGLNDVTLGGDLTASVGNIIATLGDVNVAVGDVNVDSGDIFIDVGLLKVGTATTVTPVTGADDIVIDGGSGAPGSGISIINTIATFIAFGDAADADVGTIIYTHSGNSMEFGAGGIQQLAINPTTITVPSNDFTVALGDVEVTAGALAVLAGNVNIALGDLDVPVGDVEVTAGFLGIGATPTEPLHVNILASARKAFFRKNINGASDPVVRIRQDHVSAGVPCLDFDQDDISEGVFNVTGSDRGAVPTSTVNSVASFRVEVNGTKYVVAAHVDQ